MSNTPDYPSTFQLEKDIALLSASLEAQHLATMQLRQEMDHLVATLGVGPKPPMQLELDFSKKHGQTMFAGMGTIEITDD